MQQAAGLPTHSAELSHNVEARYHVPGPELLFGALTAEKCQRYIINWLAIRLNWMEQINGDLLQKIPTVAMWCCLLNSGPSSKLMAMSTTLSCAPMKVAHIKSEVLEVFGPACTVFMLGGERPYKDSVQWHDQDIDFATLSDPPPVSSVPSCGKFMS